MDILFSTKKLEKLCNSKSDAVIEWGDECGKKIFRRLDDLRAADNFNIMMSLPGRCHELKGNRKGQWSLDLKHPLRLIIVPSDNPLPMKVDGSIDLEKVTVVTIFEVVDTHE